MDWLRRNRIARIMTPLFTLHAEVAELATPAKSLSLLALEWLIPLGHALLELLGGVFRRQLVAYDTLHQWG